MADTETSDDWPDEETCGFTYDHDLQLVDERDGTRTFHCRECGAEITEDDEL